MKIADMKELAFLKQDIFSTPSLAADQDVATALMRIRLDSRGGAIKRTIIGHRDNYQGTLTNKKNKIDGDASKNNIMIRKVA